MPHKIAATFDIIKWEDDYTLEDFQLLHSHPGFEDAFLFHEDLLGDFLQLEDWEKLPANRLYRIFIVLALTPTYSTSWEFGQEFDEWDWDILVLTYEDLGAVEDDSGLESK